MERDVPGTEGVFLRIDDSDVELTRNGKTVKPFVPGDSNSLYWRLRKGVYKKVEDVVEMTFPGLDKNLYMPALYKGLANKRSSNKRNRAITEDVTLVNLWEPTTYYVKTPLDVDLEKILKEKYGKPVISVEEGNEVARWNEFYFRTTDHMELVVLFFENFFKKS